MISAIQKAYQLCEIPENFMKIQRQGIKITNCLIAALTMLMIPFPSPEEKYPYRIVLAARTKKTEMARMSRLLQFLCYNVAD